MVRRYVAFLQRTYWFVLPVVILISIAAAFPTIGLFANINTDLAALLPDDFPSVKAARDLNKKVVKKQGITVVLEFDQPKKGPEVVAGVARELLKSPYVSEAIFYRQGYDFFKKNGLLYLSVTKLNDLYDRMDREIQKRKLGGLYIDFEEEDEEEEEAFDLKKFKEKHAGEMADFPSEYYSNEEETIYSILLHSPVTSPDFDYMERSLGDVKSRLEALPLIRDGKAKVYYSGGFVTRLNEYHTLLRDLRVAGIVAFIGITLFLTWRFRRPDALLFVFIPFSCALFWDFSITSWVIGELNIVTAFLFSILFGMGVDFGIHLLARYWEERRGGSDVAQALTTTLATTGRSCLTAGFTTAPAFYLLMINDFKGFSEFGFIAGTGLVLSVAGFLLVMPCLFLLAERVGLKPPAGRTEPVVRLFDVGLRHSRLTTAIFSILLIGSIIASFPLLGFEYDFKKLKARMEYADIARDKMRESVRGGGTAAVILVRDEEDIPKLREKVEEVMEEPEAISSQFFSYDRFVPENQEEKKKVIARIDKRLDDDALNLLKDDEREKIDDFRAMLNPDSITEARIPSSVRESFFGKEDVPGQLAFVKPKRGIELDDGRNAMRFADEVRTIKVNGKVYNATSINLIFADVLSTMLKDSKRAIPLTVVAVLLVLWIDFRSWRRVAIVASPLIMGIGLMFGTMCVTGIMLNFYNMIVLPVVLGLGVDYGVHFYHRYLEGGAGSIGWAMRHTGSAIFVTATTTMLGFLGLALANHAGLSSLGTLAVIGIAACLVSSIIFFPAFLRFWELRAQRK